MQNISEKNGHHITIFNNKSDPMLNLFIIFSRNRPTISDPNPVKDFSDPKQEISNNLLLFVKINVDPTLKLKSGHALIFLFFTPSMVTPKPSRVLVTPYKEFLR